MVTIVVPIYQTPLTADEQVSLAHLRHFLGRYPIVVACPEDLDVEALGFPVRRFPPQFFASRRGYNALMLWPAFYEAFAEHDYILIYQLDCLVFSDQLAAWCARGYDFVGAPWLEKFATDPATKLWRVGNGGFSLRHVQRSLEVLTRCPGDLPPELLEGTPLAQLSPVVSEWNGFDAALRKTHQQDLLARLTFDYRLHEDNFWAFGAPLIDRSWKVPSAEEALGFAFEVAPRRFLSERQGRLPFGCHAWTRYDRGFWTPYLLSGQGRADDHQDGQRHP